MIKNIMKNIGTKPEMLNKSWSQEDVIEELPKGWKRVEGATTSPNGYIVVSNNKSRFGGDRETKLIKQEDYDDVFDSAGKERPSTQVAYLKGWKDPQLKEAVKKAITTHNATGNNLMNVLYQKGVLGKDPGAKDLYDKLDKMGTTYSEQFINQLAVNPEYDATK